MEYENQLTALAIVYLDPSDQVGRKALGLGEGPIVEALTRRAVAQPGAALDRTLPLFILRERTNPP
jgi:hypothetical protein